jgi:hypothetical protein
MRYLVKYEVSNIIASSVVSIDNASNDIDRDIAKKLLLTNQSQILKKTKEFGSPRKVIEDDDLLIILSALEATHLSGSKTLEQSFIDNVLDFYPKNKNLKNLVKIWSMKKLSFTQMLNCINIDTVVVVLLESGSGGNANQTTQSFKEAKKYLKLSNEANALKSGALSNVLFGVISVAMILFMPFLLVEPYNKIFKIKNIAEPSILSFMNFIVNNIFSIIFVLSAIVTFFVFSFFNKKTFNFFKKIHPWKTSNDLKNLKNAINFLPIYDTLKKIDRLDIDIVNFYKKINPIIGTELIDCIETKGQSLSQAVINTSLSKKLAKQMSVIFEIDDNRVRSEIIESTIESLNIQIKKQSKKIATLIMLVSKLLLLSAGLFFAGVYSVGLSL